ncbi:MAG: 1-deoxy-D-xylulose-5-phosphate reductoisomerase [bacterium]
MKSIVILGSTGSIGENTLRIAELLPNDIRVVGLSTRTKITRLIDQALQFNVRIVAVEDETRALEAEALARPHGIRVLAGPRGIETLAALPEADCVVCSVVGLAGLNPVLAAMDAGHDVALATKEVLVSAGDLVMRKRAEKRVRLLPIDSEHSALFQCLQSVTRSVACVRLEGDGKAPSEEQITKLVLTASGGPFANRPEIDFERVTPDAALKHPRWSMGPKVTIDSATMMNKGLEILEARWLFDVPVRHVEVVVHPESVVHSMVTFIDGSSIAQLSVPDMRFAIQYALTWPERCAVDMPKLDLTQLGTLTFQTTDLDRFPCLRLIREAAACGGTMPAVVNAADEVAVKAFLDGRISFAGIWRTIEEVMSKHDVRACSDLETILETDAWARRLAMEVIS